MSQDQGLKTKPNTVTVESIQSPRATSKQRKNNKTIMSTEKDSNAVTTMANLITRKTVPLQTRLTAVASTAAECVPDLEGATRTIVGLRDELVAN